MLLYYVVSARPGNYAGQSPAKIKLHNGDFKFVELLTPLMRPVTPRTQMKRELILCQVIL